MFLDFSHSE
jgi:predicted nucleotidyltransferase